MLLVIGLPGTSLRWFQSYITESKQCSCCEREPSNKLPQGSILEPLLFIIYINDLTSVLESCSVLLFYFFTDDTVICCYGTTSQELSENLSKNLFIVAKWLNNHKLTLNLEKIKCIIIGSSCKLESKMPLSVLILDHNIYSVYTLKYLGIFISSDSTWTYPC